MSRTIRRERETLILSVVMLLITFADLCAQQSSFTIRRSVDGVEVSESGKPVFFFQAKMKSLEGKWPRASYVHPLYGLDGQILTEDFPEDHRHHRGIFWAWHQLRWQGKQMADAWKCQGIEWLPPQQEDNSVRTASSNERAGVSVVRDWAVRTDNGNAKRLVRERVEITLAKSSPVQRAIDFTIRLLALEPNVAIGGSEDEKGYGGFSPRLRLSDDVTFVGQKGPVEPRITPVDGGAWMRVSGTIDGKPTGVTIMCHPSHPNFPLKWILRSKNSVQNVAWPGRRPVALDTEAATVLRYRILIDRGNVMREEIEQHYKSFSRPE